MASRASRPPSNAGSSSRKPSSSTCSRNSTTSGWGRITSATSSSASPISEVTLFGTDCESVSAAFFSPSQSSSCSFSHQAASIAAMKVWWLRGSNSRAPELLDVGEDEVEQRRPGLAADVVPQRATDSWLLAISSVTMAGSGSIGSGATAPPGSAQAGPSSGSGGMKSPRSMTVSQRVPEQRIALPEELEQACAACRRGQASG